MNKLELNIGLEGNKMSVQQIIIELYKCLGQDTIDGFKVEMGEYEGEPERTLVIKGFTHYHLMDVVEYLTYLTENMEQEAVAISSEQYDLMVYDRGYIGKKQKFNEEFFIRYEK